MDPVWLSLLLLRPWMGYGYTIIQVVCWVKLPEQRRLCPIFVKIWISINGTQQYGIGSLDIHKNSASSWVVNGTPEFLGVTKSSSGGWYPKLNIFRYIYY